MTPEEFQQQVRAVKQALQRGQFSIAMESMQTLFSASLSDQQKAETHYLTAVIQRLSKQYNEAFKHIDALLGLKPDYGRGYQELAYCHEATGNHQAAATAFFKATHFTPALISSWKTLLTIY